MGEVNTVLRRRNGSGGEHEDERVTPIRMSGTTTQQEASYERDPIDGDLGPAIGRQGNDNKTPDADYYLINQENGSRLQDFANSHLSEGPKPGRVPRRWTNLVKGILGQHISGEPDGDSGVTKANQMSGGSEDQSYIPHLNVPRNSTLARGFMRTVDDAAPIPAIFIGDPTRR